MYSIHIDEENKNKFVELCKIGYGKINMTCNYNFYSDSLLNFTPLPKVLIDLICVWINDEIVIWLYGYEDYFRIRTCITTCINFYDVDIDCCLLFKYNPEFCFEEGPYDMYFCNNILQTGNGKYPTTKQYDEIKKTYLRTVHGTKKFTDIGAIVEPNHDELEIVNYELWLIACNIIYVVQDIIEWMANIKSI